jgi:guanine deaminase
MPTDPAAFMAEAIRLARDSVRSGGGPFGCVVVKGGRIVARGHNQVTARNDPTAHAEVTAIREACRHLQAFQLGDCELYTSCEPCPMCLGAIYWAHIPRVYFAANRADAAAAGFDDDFIYSQVPLPPEERSVAMRSLLREEAVSVFGEWIAKPDKIPY